MSSKKMGILIFTGVALLIGLSLSSQVVETNNDGFYQIKQAAVSGEMSVKATAGMYMQNFGKITTYQISDMYYFSTDDLDGGDGKESQPISVRFNDGGTALNSGFIKFRLSTKESDQLLVHKEFKSYDSVVNDLIRQHVASALKQTASLMKAESTYSSRRSEFIAITREQIIRGIFKTTPTVEKVTDLNGKGFIKRGVKILTNETGEYIVKRPSPFIRYGIEVLDFNIKDIDFDETIDALIAKKKEAQQKMVVAKAQAEEAKQNAITSLEKGKANIAIAKAEQEVEKITAVTKAEKEKAVAQLNAQKDYDVAKLAAEKKLAVATLDKKAADQNAAAKLVLGESEAKVAKLKVAAGLTPLQKAMIAKETAIGVSAELSKIKLPGILISGKGGNGGSVNPLDALGINALYDLQKKISKGK